MLKRQMQMLRAKAALAEIAKREGISVKEVRAEIDLCIREAMQSSDPIAQAKWKQISPDGHIPTAEEFISILSDEIKK